MLLLVPTSGGANAYLFLRIISLFHFVSLSDSTKFWAVSPLNSLGSRGRSAIRVEINLPASVWLSASHHLFLDLRLLTSCMP